MTHKITSVLLQKMCLQTLVLDLLIWLYYPEQILPFSQVNISHSVEWEKKLSCSEYPHPPTPKAPYTRVTLIVVCKYGKNISEKCILK